MKIVIVGTAYPLRGGIAHYINLLSSHLCKKHEVEIITFKRQYPKLLFPGKTQEESGEQHNIKPAPQLVDSINPLNWISVASYIRNLKPDLMIFKYWLPFFGPCFGTIAKLVKKKINTKVLFICDNVIPHERRPGDFLFTRYAFKQADYFIVQSHAVEKELRLHFPDAKYRLVSHPVYENFGSAVPKEQARDLLGISAKKVILYFGYIRSYKGLNVLIEAVKKMIDIKNDMQDTLLLSVGEFYDDEKKYRQLVSDLKIEDNVKFIPDYVPNDKVSLYFSAADVVVLPYLSATQSGIAQIAYNFDKPIIATNVGGLAEVVIHKKTGFVVLPNDAKALAQAVIEFYSSDNERIFIENVKIEKKKYTWDNLVGNIEDLMNK